MLNQLTRWQCSKLTKTIVDLSTCNLHKCIRSVRGTQLPTNRHLKCSISKNSRTPTVEASYKMSTILLHHCNKLGSTRCRLKAKPCKSLIFIKTKLPELFSRMKGILMKPSQRAAHRTQGFRSTQTQLLTWLNTTTNKFRKLKGA